MKELKDALNTIRKTSSRIISRVENEYNNIYMERHPEIVPDNEPVKDTSEKAKSSEVKDDKTESFDDSPLVDEAKEKVIAERRILGTVRILPDGAGGKKPSLLDSLKVEKEKIKNKLANNTGRDEKGVAI